MLALVAADPRVVKIVKKFKPAVILISGCQDNQTSLDGDHNGAFTEQLLKVWNAGAFKGDYVKFHARDQSRPALVADAEPFPARRRGDFLKQQPFTV